MRNEHITGWHDLSTDFFPLSNSLWALVPLEAWRRGLQVRLLPDACYQLSDGLRTLSFRQTRLSGAEYDKAARDLDDKQFTRELMLSAGLPAPRGKLFTGDFDPDEVVHYAEALGFPVCIKPNALAKGRGVFPNLRSADEARVAVSEILDAAGGTGLVVEQHITGHALRVFVAGSKIIAVTLAEPANVVGDGVSTIAELVEMKAEARKVNPHLRNHVLRLDDGALRVLAKQSLSPSSVPDVDEVVSLREAANLAQGGDSWDLTPDIPEHVADLAVKAIAASPSIRHGGVDILMNGDGPDAEAFINEVNPSAGIGGHVYPGFGHQRDVPSSIVDLYFPDTRKAPGAHNWCFGLGQMIRLLNAGVASSIEVPAIPTDKDIDWLTLRVDVPVSSAPALRGTLFRKLSDLRVNGNVGAATAGKFDVSVAGTKRQVDSASRVITRLAKAAGGTRKVASRSRRLTAVGMRLG